MTLNVERGGNAIAPTPPPGDSTDRIATTAFVTGAIAGAASNAIKNPVLVATTGANITLSGEQTIDGVLTSASRVLVKDQTVASQNGIYVSAPGAWARASDMTSAGSALNETMVLVDKGSLNVGRAFVITTPDPITIGTTAMAWSIAPSPALPWFNVRLYGATGNGVTDDTTAINSAIAAFNTATAGVLYFPAGIYLTSAALTTISANGLILGDGRGGGTNTGETQNAVSQITNTTTNASVFTVTNTYLRFSRLSILNTAGSTPVAGSAGITVTSANPQQRVDYDTITVEGFNIDIDIQTGSYWSMFNCICSDPVLYGIRIRNINNVDFGDWSIANSACINSSTLNATSAVRIESSGGGKIVNFKVNTHGATGGFVNGIDVVGASNTSDLFIANASIENFSGVGIKVAGAAAACWPNIAIVGVNVNPFTTGAVNAISINNDQNVQIEGLLVQGTFSGVLINLTGTISNIGVGSVCAAGVTAALYGATFPDKGAPSLLTSALNQAILTVTDGTSFAALTMNNTGTGGVQANMQATATGFPNPDLAAYGIFNSSGKLVLISDGNLANAGAHAISLRAGGFDIGNEVLAVVPTGTHQGQCKFSNSSNFTVNGAVATVLGSVGPTGSRTAVQKWLTIQDGAGNPFYIPCF